MVQKIFDNLAPGGYFEFQDPCLPMLSDDGTLDGTALNECVFSVRWKSLSSDKIIKPVAFFEISLLLLPAHMHLLTPIDGIP